jgi:hypothetical protein
MNSTTGTPEDGENSKGKARFLERPLCYSCEAGGLPSQCLFAERDVEWKAVRLVR